MNTSTAHPHVEADGTVFNMGNSFQGKKGPHYNIIKFPPAKEVDGKYGLMILIESLIFKSKYTTLSHSTLFCLKGTKVSSFEQAEIVASIPCQWKGMPSYYHSFGIAENYFIFIEQPFCFNLKKFLVNHFVGRPYLSSTQWLPHEKVHGLLSVQIEYPCKILKAMRNMTS